MPPPCLQVVADDLSGAAECAAALARASRTAASLVLQGDLPAAGSWALDTDSRALPPAAAAELAALTLRRLAAGRGEPALLFKKIDSTLRGNLAAELRGMLAAPDLVQAAVVCPTLPAQGRTLRDGVLHVHGQAQVNGRGGTLDLPVMLAAADTRPLLLRPNPSTTAGELARDLVAAARAGHRVLVVDAADQEDLRRLAQAMVAAGEGARLLGVGAAGFAGALADELLTPAAPVAGDPAEGRAAGPCVAVVGSFNSVSTGQVEELAREPDVHLLRLSASAWIAQPVLVAQHVAAAVDCASRGQSIVLAATGAVPVASTRELVHRMAAAADPLIRQASALMLTGGDTARAVLDRLGIQRLQVLGELEPGICLSRSGASAPAIVTKAGGFGDGHSLVRVLRHFRPAPPTNESSESKE